MRIVITGATGSIGAVVVQHLRAEGTRDLVGLAGRLHEGPDGRRVEGRSTDLGTDACHDTPVEASTGAEAAVHLVSGSRPSHRSRA